MIFQDAVRALTSPANYEVVAIACDCHIQSIRQAMLNPGTKGYRPPPKDWEQKLVALAMKQGDMLHQLALELQEQRK